MSESDLIVYGIAWLVPIVIGMLAGIAGQAIERRHYRSIRRREAESAALPAVTIRAVDPGRPVASATLVTASVVISQDVFKRLLARIRMIFGGRVPTYESLLDRARREAILRLKTRSAGADVILNLRLDMANISDKRGRSGTGSLEVLASGTAVTWAPDAGVV